MPLWIASITSTTLHWGKGLLRNVYAPSISNKRQGQRGGRSQLCPLLRWLFTRSPDSSVRGRIREAAHEIRLLHRSLRGLRMAWGEWPSSYAMDGCDCPYFEGGVRTGWTGTKSFNPTSLLRSKGPFKFWQSHATSSPEHGWSSCKLLKGGASKFLSFN